LTWSSVAVLILGAALPTFSARTTTALPPARSSCAHVRRSSPGLDPEAIAGASMTTPAQSVAVAHLPRPQASGSRRAMEPVTLSGMRRISESVAESNQDLENPNFVQSSARTLFSAAVTALASPLVK